MLLCMHVLHWGLVTHPSRSPVPRRTWSWAGNPEERHPPALQGGWMLQNVRTSLPLRGVSAVTGVLLLQRDGGVEALGNQHCWWTSGAIFTALISGLSVWSQWKLQEHSMLENQTQLVLNWLSRAKSLSGKKKYIYMPFLYIKVCSFFDCFLFLKGIAALSHLNLFVTSIFFCKYKILFFVLLVGTFQIAVFEIFLGLPVWRMCKTPFLGFSYRAPHHIS